MRALFYHITHSTSSCNIPFITENDPLVGYLPPRYTGAQIFNYIESELNAITNTSDTNNCLSANGSDMYGRATLGAAYTLQAKLYLNAKVYTTPTIRKCIRSVLQPARM